MVLLLTTLVSLLGLAHAGVVSELGPGAGPHGLVLCTPEPCTRSATYWLSGAPEGVLPILPVDTAMATEATWRGSDRAAEDFTAALTRAREAWAADRAYEVEPALDRARLSLYRTDAVVSTEDLFASHFLLGAAPHARDGDFYQDAFAQAAAVAWNREVALPVDDPAVRAAYFEVLSEALDAEPATLQLHALQEGETWTLDGVELGRGPWRVKVLPGEHRVVAVRARDQVTVARSARLRAGERLTLEAALPEPVDPDTLREALRGALDGDEAPAALHDWLGAWCDYVGVGEVRIVLVEEDPPGGGTHRARTVVYDAARSRFRRDR